MYHIATCFDVPPERRQDFVCAALEDGRNSLANELGTKRFELIQDKENLNRLYLNEAYADEASFNDHANGPYFKKFFDIIGAFTIMGPRLIEGTRIEDAARPGLGITQAAYLPGLSVLTTHESRDLMPALSGRALPILDIIQPPCQDSEHEPDHKLCTRNGARY